MSGATGDATDEVWDVAVVGAGPAGTAAALAALKERPTARVLLLDRDDFPRDKSCGDGIAPHVLDVLERLDAADVVEGWKPLQHLELSRGSNVVRGRMARPVHVIPREVFDARLVERAVAAGASLVRHRVRRVQVEQACVVLDGEVRARTVIGADGAQSAVRKALFAPTPGRMALAIRGYAPTSPERSGSQVIRYGQGPAQPSYAWAFDRGDGLSNVGYGELVVDHRALTRQLLLDRLEELLPGAVEHGTQWRAHHLPLSGRGWKREQPDGPVLFAGDAAGLINPMTGEGIYYAVATGALAGATAVTATRSSRGGSAGAQYRAVVRTLLNRHLQHTWVAGHLTTRSAVVDAGITGARRHQRTFDDLVELGLGDGLLTPRLVTSLATALARNQLSRTGGR